MKSFTRPPRLAVPLLVACFPFACACGPVVDTAVGGALRANSDNGARVEGTMTDVDSAGVGEVPGTAVPGAGSGGQQPVTPDALGAAGGAAMGADSGTSPAPTNEPAADAGAGDPNTADAGRPTAGPPSPPGPELIPDRGWVDSTSNSVDVEGEFFTFTDNGGSTISPESFENAMPADNICVSGSTAAKNAPATLANGDVGRVYGSSVGLAFNSLDAYDASAHGVDGFGFTLSGVTSGRLRIDIKVAGDNTTYCLQPAQDCSEGCSLEVALSDFRANCWAPGGGRVDVTRVHSIRWTITSAGTKVTPFSFCVENLTALMY